MYVLCMYVLCMCVYMYVCTVYVCMVQLKFNYVLCTVYILLNVVSMCIVKVNISIFYLVDHVIQLVHVPLHFSLVP